MENRTVTACCLPRVGSTGQRGRLYSSSSDSHGRVRLSVSRPCDNQSKLSPTAPALSCRHLRQIFRPKQNKERQQRSWLLAVGRDGHHNRGPQDAKPRATAEKCFMRFAILALKELSQRNSLRHIARGLREYGLRSRIRRHSLPRGRLRDDLARDIVPLRYYVRLIPCV